MIALKKKKIDLRTLDLIKCDFLRCNLMTTQNRGFYLHCKTETEETEFCACTKSVEYFFIISQFGEFLLKT